MRDLGKRFQIPTYDSVDQINAGNVTVLHIPTAMGSPEELKEVTALVSRLSVSGVFDMAKETV